MFNPKCFTLELQVAGALGSTIPAVDCTHKLWRHSGMYKSPFVHNYVALSWPVFCDIDPDPVSPAFVSFLPLRQSSHRDAASRERQKKASLCIVADNRTMSITRAPTVRFLLTNNIRSYKSDRLGVLLLLLMLLLCVMLRCY